MRINIKAGYGKAIVTRDYATKNQDVLERLLRALIQATHFLATHQEEAQRIVTTRLHEDAAIIKAMWGDLNFEVSLRQWLLTTLEAEARWAVSREIVAKKELPNYLDFLLIGPLERVSPQAVTIFR